MATVDDRDIGQAVKSAHELIEKILTFSSEIADNKMKYSAWIAALATAGFALGLSNLEKMQQHSWLLGHPKLLGALFTIASASFLLAIACSAAILLVSNRYLATFKREISLICQREFAITNHLKVFTADAEVRLVMRGVPTAFIADQIFEDLAEPEGGALVEMDYGSEPVEKNTGDYKEQQTATEFRLLTLLFKSIASNLCRIKDERLKDEQMLAKLLFGQQILVGFGYFALLVFAAPF